MTSPELCLHVGGHPVLKLGLAGLVGLFRVALDGGRPLWGDEAPVLLHEDQVDGGCELPVVVVDHDGLDLALDDAVFRVVKLP